MPGMFAWCSKTLRSMCETFQCDICFSFVFHVIETPIGWSQPPRVVRVYVVGSFHPTFSLLRERKSRGHADPKTTLFLALRTFWAWRLIASPSAWKVARASRVNPRCMIYDVTFARGVYQDPRFPSNYQYYALTRFIFYSTFDRVWWRWN